MVVVVEGPEAAGVVVGGENDGSDAVVLAEPADVVGVNDGVLENEGEESNAVGGTVTSGGKASAAAVSAPTTVVGVTMEPVARRGQVGGRFGLGQDGESQQDGQHGDGHGSIAAEASEQFADRHVREASHGSIFTTASVGDRTVSDTMTADNALRWGALWQASWGSIQECAPWLRR